MSKSISVIIATKNADKLLKEVLGGFMKQTKSPKEIIVVGPKRVIKNIRKSFKLNGVNLITSNGDKNSARNRGFELSRGSHVLYVDDDMVPSPNLIEKCLDNLDSNNALIVPEYGHSGDDLLSRIFNLEKRVAMTDKDALTPRLFRRDLFKRQEKPFNPEFGVLDEWGFYANLKSKKPRVGKADGQFTVKDRLGWVQRVRKNFNKGRWVGSLKAKDPEEGNRRSSLVKRGLKVYLGNLKFLFEDPITFVGLVVIKLADYLSFSVGNLVSKLFSPKLERV